MKLSIFTYLLFLLPIIVKSQKQPYPDSLHQALNVVENDSVRLELLEDFYGYYAESNIDSALYYTDLALAESKKIKQSLWTAMELINKSYLLQKQGNLSMSFKLLNESMAIVKDERSEQNVFFPKSIRKYIDSPHEWRIYLLGGVLHNLGNTNSRAGNMEKAILNFKEVIRITKEIREKNSITHASMNIANSYLEMNKLDSAMLYARNAIMFSNNSTSKTYQSVILNTLGKIFVNQNQLDSAKYYYRKSLKVGRENNNVTSEVLTNIYLAQLYEGIAQTDSMLNYATVAFKLASGLKAGRQIATSAELISKAYKRKGNLESALTYLTISKIMTDSLNKERTEKLMDFQSVGFEEQMRLEKAVQESVVYKNKIRTGLLLGGIAVISIFTFIFFRNNRQKQRANKVLESTLANLKSTQSQLIQSEKMASLGELTAGIAHEIQNPLNFVNNFSELSVDLAQELKEEVEKLEIPEKDKEYVTEIIGDLSQNQEKINHHGKRASDIVKGMLEHSRKSTGEKEATDINALCDEYLRLAYQSQKAKDNDFNATMETHFDPNLPKIDIIPQDIGRVLLNLINNAFYVVNERKNLLNLAKQSGDANLTDLAYKPTVSITTQLTVDNHLDIAVKDNGSGIPEHIKDKIFQPFFTTKPTGQGTGLGLSLSYDIVKAHGGELKVSTQENEGTEFTIKLPI
ncbi:MAG: ATP-binding protein [Saprospiraceae bacterium]